MVIVAHHAAHVSHRSVLVGICPILSGLSSEFNLAILPSPDTWQPARFLSPRQARGSRQTSGGNSPVARHPYQAVSESLSLVRSSPSHVL